MRVSKLVVILAMALAPIVFLQFHFITLELHKVGSFMIPRQHLRVSGTLSFRPCESFEDHRLGIVLGAVLAKYLGRVLIFPSLGSSTSPLVPLSDLYNESALVTKMEEFKIKIGRSNVASANPHNIVTCSDLDEFSIGCMERLKVDHNMVDDLVVDCPFPNPSLSPLYVEKESNMFWAIIEALEPSEQAAGLIDRRLEQIRGMANVTDFNFIDGWNDQNMNGLLDIMGSKGLGQEQAVYMAGNVSGLWSPQKQVLKFSNDLGNGSSVHFEDHRKRMIDFYVGLESSKALSDPRTTFGGILMMERRQKRMHSAGIVGEQFGLNQRIPLMKFPWVVFHEALNKDVEYMLKVAVRSANRLATIWPLVILSGEDTEMDSWLRENEVTVLHHKVPWAKEYYKNEAAAKERASRFEIRKDRVKISIGDSQQIEIPNVDFLQQFEYVLSTSPSILLRKGFPLDMFGRDLPSVVGVFPQGSQDFPFDGGVRLWNVTAVGDNYDKLLEYVKNPRRKPKLLSLDTIYGVKTLQEEMESWKFHERFVVKAYMGYDVHSFIVDFSGMMPHEYAGYVRSGKCVHDICFDGIFRGWCNYFFEWASLLEEEEVDIGLPVMKECIKKVCGFRGGCRRWIQAVEHLTA